MLHTAHVKTTPVDLPQVYSPPTDDSNSNFKTSANFLKINTGNKLQGQHLTCQCIGNSTLGCLENPSVSWGLFSPRCEYTCILFDILYFNRQNLLVLYFISYHILWQDLLLLCPHHPCILLWTVRCSVLNFQFSWSITRFKIRTVWVLISIQLFNLFGF